jgi:hypothetical protein
MGQLLGEPFARLLAVTEHCPILARLELPYSTG